MLLIAVKSCQRDRLLGFHKAIRETWATGLPDYVRLLFFAGRFEGPLGHAFDKIEGDEIVLDCPDDYRSLPYKTKAILKWFLKETYENIFLCDNDTLIDPKILLSQKYQDVDYAGRFGFWPTGTKMGTTFRYNDGQGNIIDPCHAWSSGGYGYFLSRKAAQAVVQTEPCSWAEDLWVGQVLGPGIISGEIKGLDLYNYGTWHFQKNRMPFTPEKLYEAHKDGILHRREWGVS